MMCSRPTGEPSLLEYPGSKVAFAAESNRLASAGFGITGGVRVHGIPSGTPMLQAFTNETLSAVAIAPNGQTVAVGTSRGVVEVIAVATGQVVATLAYADPNTATVRDVAYSPDGTMLAASGSRLGGASVAAKVWRTSDYGLIHTLSPMEQSFGDIVFTPDSTIVAAASTDSDFSRWVRFWDATTGQLLHSFEADRLVNDLAFSSRRRPACLRSGRRRDRGCVQPRGAGSLRPGCRRRRRLRRPEHALECVRDERRRWWLQRRCRPGRR